MNVEALADAVNAHFADAPPDRLKLVAVTGSVAVGKSTFARALASALSAGVGVEVPVLATDGFLFSEEALTRVGLLDKKGCPETFDSEHLAACLAALARGESVVVPEYAHAARGVVGTLEIASTRWLIVEGVFSVQPCRASGLPCCAVFVTADLAAIEARYMARAFAIRTALGRGTDPESMRVVRQIFHTVNVPNLTDHIAPLRAQCDFVAHVDGLSPDCMPQESTPQRGR